MATKETATNESLNTTTALTSFLNIATGSDPGRVRQSNEDTVFAYLHPDSSQELSGLLIVADGMGGHQAGEIASFMAVKTIFSELLPLLNSPATNKRTENVDGDEAIRWRKTLEKAVKRANREIYGYSRKYPIAAGNLGTTVACVFIRGGRALVANVGDSRVYLLRAQKLRQLTVDHSIVAQLVREGRLKPESVYDHPQRSVITRALGHHPDVDVDIFQQTLHPGDRLMLCSDGLWEMIRERDVIVRSLVTASSPQDAVQELISTANANGGRDNISIVLGEFIDS